MRAQTVKRLESRYGWFREEGADKDQHFTCSSEVDILSPGFGDAKGVKCATKVSWVDLQATILTVRRSISEYSLRRKANAGVPLSG